MWVVVEIVDETPIIVQAFPNCDTNYEAMEYYRDVCAENRDRYYHVWRVNFSMGHLSDISDHSVVPFFHLPER